MKFFFNALITSNK